MSCVGPQGFSQFPIYDQQNELEITSNIDLPNVSSNTLFLAEADADTWDVSLTSTTPPNNLIITIKNLGSEDFSVTYSLGNTITISPTESYSFAFANGTWYLVPIV